MMQRIQTFKWRHLLVACLAVGPAGACRDADKRPSLSPVTESQAAFAQLLVDGRDPIAPVVVTLWVTSPAQGPRSASITAAVRFDTTRLTFARDDASGGMRAVHADGDLVLLAVASPAPLDSVVARLQFARKTGGRDSGTFQLTVRELHGVDGTDLATSLVVLPAVVLR